MAKCPQDGVPVELLVLRGERVDGRRDDPHPGLVEPRGHVLLHGENVRLSGGQIGAQERPRLIGPLVGLVASDMAAPHHAASRLNERRRHPRRLGIVQDHYIPRVGVVDHTSRGHGGDLLIVVRLRGTERTAIACCSVQAIVDPLGDGEEVGITSHDEPVDVEAGIEGVADEHLQHLGDAAPSGRRIDVPHRPPTEIPTRSLSRTHEPLVAIPPNEGLQHRQRTRGHRDLADGVRLEDHAIILPVAAAAPGDDGLVAKGPSPLFRPLFLGHP